MEEHQHNRTRKITIRLTSEEYTRISRKMATTTCRKLSEYCRKKMLEKPLTVYHRNLSLDQAMMEFIELRKTLNGLANNYNQSVKRLHTLTEDSPLRSWLTAYQLEGKILLNKVEDIKSSINKIADLWLR